MSGMNPSLSPLPPPPLTPGKLRRLKHLVALVVMLLLAYGFATYLVIPVAWTRYTGRHPALEDIPDITHTGSGIPGDPLNVALIGTETEVKRLLLAAKWYPADGLTWRSCLEIAAASVLKRPYDDAPVSNLYLWGRKEDLAFEQPVGDNPRKRNHVRFWRSPEADADGRPVWVGSATYDERVGFSHTTGQITHHIDADIDRERDHLFADFDETGMLSETYVIDDFHKIRTGRNGGGDPWYTDGRLLVGVIGGK
jgi:hypothetical protein